MRTVCILRRMLLQISHVWDRLSQTYCRPSASFIIELGIFDVILELVIINVGYYQ